MDVTHWGSNIMPRLIVNQLQRQLKGIKFVNSGNFYWSPKTKTIHYNSAVLETEAGVWALIHEAAHAKLDHQSYMTDMGLLGLEVTAWQAAEDVATELGLSIDSDHVQECLNTYRDWLYARSTCPTCELNSLQIEETVYLCVNCMTRWSVSQSRFCRPYRMVASNKQELETRGQKQTTDIAFR